jgi:hypothetical protein
MVAFSGSHSHKQLRQKWHEELDMLVKIKTLACKEHLDIFEVIENEAHDQAIGNPRR